MISLMGRVHKREQLAAAAWIRATVSISRVQRGGAVMPSNLVDLAFFTQLISTILPTVRVQVRAADFDHVNSAAKCHSRIRVAIDKRHAGGHVIDNVNEVALSKIHSCWGHGRNRWHYWRRRRFPVVCVSRIFGGFFGVSAEGWVVWVVFIRFYFCCLISGPILLLQVPTWAGTFWSGTFCRFKAGT